MGRYITRTEQAMSLYLKGELKRSLSIFKTFKLTFSKSELRIIEIAYESLCGRASFYESLGINTSEMLNQSKELINKTYFS